MTYLERLRALEKQVAKLQRTFCCTKNGYPEISFGDGAPTTTPFKIGDIYVDETNKKLYFASGTASSSDWTIAN